jgi:hypothetical protein
MPPVRTVQGLRIQFCRRPLSKRVKEGRGVSRTRMAMFLEKMHVDPRLRDQ